MREIRFRAWDKGFGKMRPLGMICIRDNGEIFALHGTEYTSLPQDLTVIMQFTGLKDSKGLEIYEGDVLAYDEFEINEDSYKGVVKYMSERDYPAFDLDPYIDCDCNGLSYIKACCQCEVIGNIYENPELINTT